MIKMKDTKHVLTIGCEYKPVRGGVAQVLDIYDKYIFEDFRFITNSGGGGFGNLHLLLVSICRLIKQLSGNRRIKIVHIHTASYNSFYHSAIFVLLTKLLGHRVILHIHGGGFKDFYRTNPEIFIRWILQRADCLVVLSASWKSFFESITKKLPIHVIPNPVVLPSVEDLSAKKSSSHLRLLFLSLLDQDKGIYDLLQVLADHKDFFESRVILNVRGNGDTASFKETVKQMGLEKFVVFHGWVSGDKKKELFLNSDVFVLPSYAEGLPMAILEAMAHGLAIVSTTVGAIPEVVGEDCGILITPGKQEELSEALKALCVSPERLELLKQSAIREGKQYSVEAIKEVLEAVYREVVR